LKLKYIVEKEKNIIFNWCEAMKSSEGTLTLYMCMI